MRRSVFPIAACLTALFSCDDSSKTEANIGDAGAAPQVPAQVADGAKPSEAQPSEAQPTTIASATQVTEQRVWALPGQSLARVAVPLGPVPDGYVVHVTTEGIETGGKRLAAFTDGKLEASALRGRLVLALFDVLDARVYKDNVAADEAGEARWRGTLVLVADATMPAAAALDVIYTAQLAKCDTFALVAESGPLKFGSVGLALPTKGATEGPPMVVRVTSDGMELPSDKPGEAPERIAKTGEGAYDLATLAAKAKAFHATHAKSTGARITFDRTIPYGVVVQTLATLHDELPDLELGTERPAVSPTAEALPHSAGILGALATSDKVDSNVLEALSGNDSGHDGAGEGGGEAQPTVKGALDKDVIRRVVRAHINEVRYCYEKRLTGDPGLKGRVAVQFTIAASGQVSSATVTDDTVGDSKVGTCIASAIQRWTFPAPDGGAVVVVTYPFVLEPK